MTFRFYSGIPLLQWHSTSTVALWLMQLWSGIPLHSGWHYIAFLQWCTTSTIAFYFYSGTPLPQWHRGWRSFEVSYHFCSIAKRFLCYDISLGPAFQLKYQRTHDPETKHRFSATWLCWSMLLWKRLILKMPRIRALKVPCRRALKVPCRRALKVPCRRALKVPCRRALKVPCRRALKEPCRRALKCPVEGPRKPNIWYF